MSLLLRMLPIYLMGNLHCVGMCGPLVMLIGQHRYRYSYFFGRTLSFSLAGAAAGALGSTLNATLKLYEIPALTSFLFGGIILLVGVSQLTGARIPLPKVLQRPLSGVDKRLSLLLLRDHWFPVLLFGLSTILLPCGQTILVFSACALEGSIAVGWINGLAFALLTTPSLWVAMHAHGWLSRWKRHYKKVVGVMALLVGIFAIYRGIADLQLAPPVCHHCSHMD